PPPPLAAGFHPIELYRPESLQLRAEWLRGVLKISLHPPKRLRSTPFVFSHRRQFDPFALRSPAQKTACRKILQPPHAVAPIPQYAQLPRQALPTPIPMRYYPSTQQF